MEFKDKDDANNTQGFHCGLLFITLMFYGEYTITLGKISTNFCWTARQKTLILTKCFIGELWGQCNEFNLFGIERYSGCQHSFPDIMVVWFYDENHNFHITPIYYLMLWFLLKLQCIYIFFKQNWKKYRWQKNTVHSWQWNKQKLHWSKQNRRKTNEAQKHYDKEKIKYTTYFL